MLTDKIVSETNNKEKVEQELAQHIRQFNKAMIESNDKMLSYCEIHKLSLEETDCVELFQLLYPGHSYQITDGKMLAICRNDVSKAKSSSVANYDDDDWDTSLDYADLFVKNGGNKYYYALPDYDYIADIDVFELADEPIKEFDEFLRR